MSTKKILSIIIPCYNEEATIGRFIAAVDQVRESEALLELDINLLFIDDGSQDRTLSILTKLSTINENIQYISFSRNFGKEAAIFAGLEKAKGDYIALMDVDLQDPPELLEEMYLSIKNENFDCVATKRKSRKGEPIIRSLFSHYFYKLINSISKTEIVEGARDYRLMTRQMVSAILALREYHRFSKGLFSWVGFNVKWLSYESNHVLSWNGNHVNPWTISQLHILHKHQA